MQSTPFFREAGAGPGVVCLHANASNSNQWRGLMELLAPSFHVLGPDSYGAGKGPSWPAERRVGLADEAALLEPVFARAGDPFFLVAHSYGAAVTLVAAVAQPARSARARAVRAHVVRRGGCRRSAPNDADGIRATVAAAGRARTRGPRRRRAVLHRLLDGPGQLRRHARARRGPILASIVNVRGWGNALFHEPTPLEAFAALRVPVFYMIGKRSPVPGAGRRARARAHPPQRRSRGVRGSSDTWLRSRILRS